MQSNSLKWKKKSTAGKFDYHFRTWSTIDHFDPSSALYRRSESEFSRLKERAADRNWDIDFDVENIDFVFDL